MTQILGHNYIGGQRSAAGNVKLQSVDATTGEQLPHDFIQATAEEVDAAAKAAAAAYPAYRSLSAERRAQFLDAIADELEDPFGRDENDLPTDALVRTIERDILAELGVADLPPPLKPIEYVLS